MGGNITIKTTYPYTTGTLGTPTATIPYTYTNTVWKDLLTKYNNDTATYTYDTIGNLLTYRNGMTFTWQNGRQLATVRINSSLVATYQYNDSGIRTKKTAGSTVTDYYLNGSSIVTEITGGVQTDYYYDAGGNIVGFKKGGSEYYYVRNGQNDIIGILNSSGSQVVAYVYDSWGKVISVTGSLAATIGATNPFRYRGYYYDTESELYYLQSRYYDPVTCRFISADSQLNPGTGLTGMNLYAYCCNNPVLMIDNEGNRPVVGMDPSS